MTQLHRELLDQARRHPDRAAIDGGKDEPLSYAELFTIIGSLVAELGAMKNARAIGIVSNRSAEAYCGALAAYFSGATFVPLNPGFPEERLAKIVELAGVDYLFCDSSSLGLAQKLAPPQLNLTPMIEGPPAPVADMADRIEAGLAIEPDAIAYQMFTSGSTGEPKGVPIPYSALDHYVRTLRERIAFPDGARFSQLFDLSFDLSIHDIFVTFASGGTLVPAGQMDLMMPHAFIDRKRIDIWFSVPMLAMQAARGAKAPKSDHRLTMALFCGEALPMDYVARFRPFVADGGPIYNLYGPTEATIAFTVRELEDSDTAFAIAPLGEVLGDNRIALLDDEGGVVPVAPGGEGELLLGGPQVFGGYDPDRGIQCFVESQSGERFYRSGDRVRRDDGGLHHLGRIDGQVKLRGHRIELGEIEAAFREAFGCDAAAAIVWGERDAGEIRLAYTGSGEVADLGPLAARLPDYMVPKRIWRRDSLPVNVNGKVDRKALGEMTWPDAP